MCWGSGLAEIGVLIYKTTHLPHGLQDITPSHPSCLCWGGLTELATLCITTIGANNREEHFELQRLGSITGGALCVTAIGTNNGEEGGGGGGVSPHTPRGQNEYPTSNRKLI